MNKMIFVFSSLLTYYSTYDSFVPNKNDDHYHVVLIVLTDWISLSRSFDFFYLIGSGEMLSSGRVMEKVLEVAVRQAVVGRDVVGVPFLVIFGRTVLTPKHYGNKIQTVF
jgi:hypothetical protein